MNFYVKKRPKPVLQIISMIDILIILLIFLVVTTTFKDPQSFVNVTLPRSESLASGEQGEPVPRLGLIVTKDEKIFIGDQPVEVENLAASLQQAKESKPGAKLELRIDEKVPFGTLIKVWEGLKTAGYKLNEVPARIMKP